MESKWVSVKERLPEDHGNYIVALKNKCVMEFTFSNISDSILWFKIGVGQENKDNPVTHWMPLPPPPTSKKRKSEGVRATSSSGTGTH